MVIVQRSTVGKTFILSFISSLSILLLSVGLSWIVESFIFEISFTSTQSFPSSESFDIAPLLRRSQGLHWMEIRVSPSASLSSSTRNENKNSSTIR